MWHIINVRCLSDLPDGTNFLTQMIRYSIGVHCFLFHPDGHEL